MERRADKGGRRMAIEFGTWRAEWVVEAQQTYYEALKVTTNQYTTG